MKKIPIAPEQMWMFLRSEQGPYFVPETLWDKYDKALIRFLKVSDQVATYANKQKKKNNDNPTSS